ncbi:23S rRNA (guanosine(2251)-2'-O)-methyltransferase RlmB [Aliifodinibius sp. S!AR15-10]|uniref:23S rRNA (guanosine(2251)-2'-O)-methyltransferase RlmB n=1 Tax=Aliifodinibius sp. S!AR15-10 TaxID=2950437 RepID=UPI0028664357|nr:23S rRNA (guanosine(2251)-2'-O)-methyltransferase RlmB [Aliifodinibius sp. S!AR15-10]MDR8389800.1 23S rRNA (guanosine(2251)-2'-O)-methyltransferase RlmB [Aliifodinibius sp. S!AR15-10]
MQNSDNNIYIYGRNPVKEALENEPERIEKIFVRQSVKDRDVQTIFDLSSNNRIPVSHVPGSKLYELVGSVNDQGIVALMSAIEYHEFGPWLDSLDLSTYPGILLLDELEDPHNVGAILRTAAAAGIDAVLVPKHRQAPINATVFKTSAGTAGRIPIVRVGNLNQSILKLKDAGFWIGGLEQEGETVLWDLEVDRPLAFVIGSEGSGIREKTLEHCDYTFAIPMRNRVESLNASVSAALMSYEWRRKKK